MNIALHSLFTQMTTPLYAPEKPEPRRSIPRAALKPRCISLLRGLRREVASVELAEMLGAERNSVTSAMRHAEMLGEVGKTIRTYRGKPTAFFYTKD